MSVLRLQLAMAEERLAEAADRATALTASLASAARQRQQEDEEAGGQAVRGEKAAPTAQEQRMQVRRDDGSAFETARLMVFSRLVDVISIDLIYQDVDLYLDKSILRMSMSCENVAYIYAVCLTRRGDRLCVRLAVPRSGLEASCWPAPRRGWT